jgi:hypothetical protein
MGWAVNVAFIGETHMYIILVGKPETKRPVGKTMRRWEDNIKMNVCEIGWEVVGWMHLAQVRDQWRAVVNTFEFYKKRKIC